MMIHNPDVQRARPLGNLLKLRVSRAPGYSHATPEFINQLFRRIARGQGLTVFIREVMAEDTSTFAVLLATEEILEEAAVWLGDAVTP